MGAKEELARLYQIMSEDKVLLDELIEAGNILRDKLYHKQTAYLTDLKNWDAAIKRIRGIHNE